MMTQDEAKGLVNQVLEEQAMVLGGLAALDEIDDEAVWRLVRSLDAIRLRALRRINRCPAGPGESDPRVDPPPRPHPAIEQFLRHLRGNAA